MGIAHEVLMEIIDLEFAEEEGRLTAAQFLRLAELRKQRLLLADQLPEDTA